MGTFYKEIHAKYLGSVGAEQIASLFALEQLEDFIASRNFRSVLELGAGIGTITELLLRTSSSVLTCVESDSWCRQQLEKNTSTFRRFTLIENYQQVDAIQSELLVIDVNNGIFQIYPEISANKALKAIFIEGHHLAHRVEIAKWLFCSGKSAKYSDLRPAKGKKGCAIFEIKQSPKFQNQYLLTIFRVVIPIYFQYFLVKFRAKIGKALNMINHIKWVNKIRNKWLNKINWNF